MRSLVLSLCILIPASSFGFDGEHVRKSSRCWKTFVRLVELGKPDRQYLLNQKNAKFFFEAWLEGSTMPYRKMLRESHRLAYRSGYKIAKKLRAARVTAELKDNEMRPGEFRKSDIEPVVISTDLQQRLFQLIEQQDLVTKMRVGQWERTIHLDHIPRFFLPRNVVVHSRSSAEKLIHRYPSYESIPAYLNAARLKMSKIRRALSQRVTTERREEIFSDLADYYQISINGHFFPRINNSILMSQVNVIAAQLGFIEIPQNYFDYLAFTLQPKDFRVTFRRHFYLLSDRLP
jgi:hypothetical protein